MFAKSFEGANVFMSRNLVPPELFDALHDALKLNGAHVLLCCDPSKNGPNDYHVISSQDHEKFGDLRAKGCKLIGPQCVFSCAKEHRTLPNLEFTCCLAMDGVSILASGFEKGEKDKIASMISAMGGVLLTKASSDANFVIVKNVLAQKYKWALNNLKKPIVTTDWLVQCWMEHRIVPQESYRVPPFLGLTICVSGIPADERKAIEMLVTQNGGQYSGDLNKRCTHLICDVPDGDKYKVAKRWGNIHIVSTKWIHQCITRRACLSEESYLVHCKSVSLVSTVKTVERYSQGKGPRSSQCTSSCMNIASDTNGSSFAIDSEANIARPPQGIYSDISGPSTLQSYEGLDGELKNESNSASFFADDSQSDDEDLYLSKCRIMLVGFVASDLRKLVQMVRRGGGSRYMYFSEKLTHVIIGKPMEIEMKEVRSIAAFGVTYVVTTAWLEECTFKKKEVPVQQSHIAYDLLFPKDPVFNKFTATTITCMKQEISCAYLSVCGSISAPQNFNTGELGGKRRKTTLINNGNNSCVYFSGLFMFLDMKDESAVKVIDGASTVPSNNLRPTAVFKGKLFRFSTAFPEEQRPEITQWVNEGAGDVVTDQNKKVNFTVESHGVGPKLDLNLQSTRVTAHWIRSCLEDGSLLDVNNHILYSPLPCEVPLPGFERYRFCVSQYDTKERKLLRNLCYVLGAKFIEKLTRKATHLLCKFASGDKYQAACRWGIKVVTAEWIHDCVIQKKIVSVEGFYPKEHTLEDQEAGSFPTTQYPVFTHKMASSDETSQHLNQLNDSREMCSIASPGPMTIDEGLYSSKGGKRTRTLGGDGFIRPQVCEAMHGIPTRQTSAGDIPMEKTKDVSCAVPDVAAAIEDLLEQTSKIQDWKSQETGGCHENFLPSNSTLDGEKHANLPTETGTPKFWITGVDKENRTNTAKKAANVYDSFSETQTDSQVVGYEEDLSGRQMIIDRVRARSSSSTMC